MVGGISSEKKPSTMFELPPHGEKKILQSPFS